MRQVGLSDLHHAARALQTVPPPNREQCARQLIWRAHVADKMVKRLCRLHPAWGDGSLRAAALQHPRQEIEPNGTQDYLHCISIILKVLDARVNEK